MWPTDKAKLVAVARIEEASAWCEFKPPVNQCSALRFVIEMPRLRRDRITFPLRHMTTKTIGELRFIGVIWYVPSPTSLVCLRRMDLCLFNLGLLMPVSLQPEAVIVAGWSKAGYIHK
jgi:hypothetical protein